MYCRYCGALYTAYDEACPNCGRLEPDPKERERQKDEEKLLREGLRINGSEEALSEESTDSLKTELSDDIHTEDYGESSDFSHMSLNLTLALADETIIIPVESGSTEQLYCRYCGAKYGLDDERCPVCKRFEPDQSEWMRFKKEKCIIETQLDKEASTAADISVEPQPISEEKTSSDDVALKKPSEILPEAQAQVHNVKQPDIKPERKKSRNTRGRIVFLLVILILTFALILAGIYILLLKREMNSLWSVSSTEAYTELTEPLKDETEALKPDKKNETTTEPSTQVTTQPEDDIFSAFLGECSVEILSCEVTKNDDEKAAVVITYSFTNMQKRSASFLLNVSTTAYQGEKELDSTFSFTDDFDLSSVFSLAEPSQTINTQIMYVLESSQLPVKVVATIVQNGETVEMEKEFSII